MCVCVTNRPYDMMHLQQQQPTEHKTGEERKKRTRMESNIFSGPSQSVSHTDEGRKMEMSREGQIRPFIPSEKCTQVIQRWWRTRRSRSGLSSILFDRFRFSSSSSKRITTSALLQPTRKQPFTPFLSLSLSLFDGRSEHFFGCSLSHSLWESLLLYVSPFSSCTKRWCKAVQRELDKKRCRLTWCTKVL